MYMYQFGTVTRIDLYLPGVASTSVISELLRISLSVAAYDGRVWFEQAHMLSYGTAFSIFAVYFCRMVAHIWVEEGAEIFMRE